MPKAQEFGRKKKKKKKQKNQFLRSQSKNSEQFKIVRSILVQFLPITDWVQTLAKRLRSILTISAAAIRHACLISRQSARKLFNLVQNSP